MSVTGTAPFDHSGARQYTLDDGLAGMRIEDIHQDRRGLLWIATADGGVSRFDGESFENFRLPEGLPHLTVMTIAEDEDGRLWFGTLGGGVAVFDGRRFRVYTTEHGLPSNEIMALKPQADGSLQVLTAEGLGRFEQDRCVEWTTEIGGRRLGRVHDMVTDATGTTWLATRERGIIDLEGRRLGPEFGPGGAHHWAWNLAEDGSGHLWIASIHRRKEAVVGRYDPQRRRLEMVDVKAPSEAAEIVRRGVRHVRVDRKGCLWVSGDGLAAHDGRDWHSLSAAFSHFPRGHVRLTYEDRDGNLWVGRWGGGLVLCCPSGVKRYAEADGLPAGQVRCLAEDRRGRIWIGTAKGLACLQGERIRVAGTCHAISALEMDGRGTLWLGDTEGTVSQVGGGNPVAVAKLAGDELDEIQALREDATGRMWASTTNGLLGSFEGDRFVALEERLPHGGKHLLRSSEGGLWIGTEEGMLVLQDLEGAHGLQACEFEGLEPGTVVNALHEHQDTLWVGKIDGLLAVDLPSGRARPPTMDPGSSANGLQALATDREGRLWMATLAGGALMYDGESLHRIRLGDSLPENTVDAVLCDRLGQVWFGTRRGLVRYRPRPTPPALVMHQVVEGRLREAPEVLSLPQDTDEIEIQLQGIRFRIDEEPMRYSHRLLGHGPAEDWSRFRPENRVSYQDLPTGEYRLEARTQDPEGNMSEIAQLQILVLGQADRKDSPSQAPEPESPPDPAAGRSPTLARLLWQLRRVARTDLTVLLRGETGTGKGLMAREIHDMSSRRGQAFIHINCGSLSSTLIESELFGHEIGSFTGAVTRKLGLIERAQGGTLFLDEIGELPAEGQRALLKFLDDGLLRRVGGVEPYPGDVRLIVATHQDLERMIREETFREDLYYRLKEFPVVVPPLRERLDEIPMLAAHFASEYAKKLRCPVPTLSAEALTHLQQHTWPGNVRELENLIRREMMLGEDQTIGVPRPSLPTRDQGTGSAAPEATASEDWNEKQQILEALEAAGGRIYGKLGAARLLGMNPERLRSRMRALGVQRPKKP